MRTVEIEAAPRRGLFSPGNTVLYARPINLNMVSRSRVDKIHSPMLADNLIRFDSIEILLRNDRSIITFRTTIDIAREWALADGCLEELDELVLNMTARRKAFSAIQKNCPLLMGVVNTAPDSFYDGGRHSNHKAAISHAHALIAAGANIIDVGGESSRPGSIEISAQEEIDRVIPVVEKVVGFGIPVSIDTKKSEVMEVAVSTGASIINDISALTADPKSLMIASKLDVPVILMHMQGRPGNMQDNPLYDFAPLDIFDYLKWRISICGKAGISLDKILVDPGIGFGKDTEHNRSILNRLSLFHGLRVPIVLGASRKSMIANLSCGEPVEERLPGSLAIALWALGQGVQVLRVHDVAETRQAIKIYQAMVDDI
ncbi:MAG: dihydropteroate synthase [Rhodospirillaceae bacterium]|nr:dihydropteroate synthase [Rhodospirillaceae bacterium]